jgi:2-methylisocitrate lyase-like PEP mutase family enzyme
MNIDEQKSKAMTFRAMHRSGKVLVLPNAWDVASARVFEEEGFGAIATTSGGVAFSLGYPDGQKISREEMLARAGRIARAVKVPVTADVEAKSLVADGAGDAADVLRILLDDHHRPSGCRKLVRRGQPGRTRPDYYGRVSRADSSRYC